MTSLTLAGPVRTPSSYEVQSGCGYLNCSQQTDTRTVTVTFSESPNKLVSAPNGVDYAYRDEGDGAVPLVMLQHFRGNLDSWDPALIDALASTRRVVTFDNAGVGGSTGTTPNTIQQMARDAVAAGQEALQRMDARTQDRDTATTWATREAQYDAVCTWGIPNHSLLQRVSAIDVPVLVANGDSDPMILPRYSYLLAGLIPHARIKIYPDAAHGFLFQYPAEFASDVDALLSGPARPDLT
jgi:pimeloyl-ACP methyl ester carboxylesterase